MIFATMRRAGGLLATLLALQAGAAAAAADCPPPPPPPAPGAAQVQAAQAEARDRGLWWRISRDGRSSLLYGSIHVGRLPWVFPGPLLKDALAASDAVALEIDATDPATQREMAQALQQLPPLELPPPLAARLADERRAACVDEPGFAAMHPLMQAVSLAVLAARREGLEPAFAQEIALAALARQQRLPVIALETVAEQLQALVPPDEETALAALGPMLEPLADGRARTMIARLGRAWDEGRLDELERYGEWCDCLRTEGERRAMRRLLDERNQVLAERVDALHRGGRRLLVAVGALHLVGPQGLPALLQQRGYRVQPLRPAPM